MDKVIHSDKNITPFGGLNFIYKALSTSKISQHIDSQLGSRSSLAQYSYSDIVLSLLGSSLCQGSFVSDLETFKKKFTSPIFSAIPSPDTVEYACQELKTSNEIVISDSGIEHQINHLQKMNKALISIAMKTNQLKKNEKLTLDFDNVVIENQKQDAKRSYKNTKAYHPNISFIGRLPVHIENRNGNTPANFGQVETLKRCFDNFDENGIKIENFRADSASCQNELMEELEKRVDFYFIRARKSANFNKMCSEIEDWKQIEINYQIKEVGVMYYSFGKGNKKRKVIVTRSLLKSYDELFPEKIYSYQGIVCNNEELSPEEIIEFYNKRGDSEKSNCYLLNDFNFNHLPFMDMDTNTVYMYLMSICSTLFEWIKQILVNNKVDGINLSMRTKAICFHYIMVASSWTNHARQNIIRIFSPEKYTILKT